MHNYIICLEPVGHYRSVLSAYEFMSFWSSADTRCMEQYNTRKRWKMKKGNDFFTNTPTNRHLQVIKRETLKM